MHRTFTVTSLALLAACNRGAAGLAQRQQVAAGHRIALLVLPGLPAKLFRTWLSKGRFLVDVPGGPVPIVPPDLILANLRAPETGRPETALASALTGHPPARHGILARSFYRRGRRVSWNRELLLAPPIWKGLAPRRVLLWNLPAWAQAPGLPAPDSVRAALGRQQKLRALETQAAAGPPAPRSSLAHWTALPDGSLLWATALPGPEARLWLQAPSARILPREIAPGQVAVAHWRGPSGARCERLLLLRQADPATGATRLLASAPVCTKASPPGLARSLFAARLGLCPSVPAKAVSKGQVTDEEATALLLACAASTVRLAKWLATRPYRLAVLPDPAFERLLAGLWEHPERPDTNPSDNARRLAVLEAALRRAGGLLAQVVAALQRGGYDVVILGTGGLAPVHTELRLGSFARELCPGAKLVGNGALLFASLPLEERTRGCADRLRQAFLGLTVSGRRPFAPPGRVLTLPRQPASVRRSDGPDLLLQAAPGFALSGRRARRLADWPTRAAVAGTPPGTGNDGFLAIWPARSWHIDRPPTSYQEVAGLLRARLAARARPGGVPGGR